MGGLGFNKDRKWEDAANRLEKMKKFSQNIGRVNAHNMKIRKSPPKKEKSKRDKALEFAMKIRKPRLKPSPERFAIEFENSKERNKMWEWENSDQKLRQEVEKIKLLFKI